MEQYNKHKGKQKFLEDSSFEDISKRHSKYLGTQIPEGYFVASKLSILEKIQSEKQLESKIIPERKTIFWLQPQFKFAVAASLILFLGLTIWFQNTHFSQEEKTVDFELLTFSDDILINSLLVDENDIESFSNITLMNEIVLKAELSEQKMDNLFLNSLFVEDSLIDNYTNKSIIESIIL
ncbi:MAG: hypothetical protein GW772_09515 [Flavobacteriia bacterium]|nr:hypothetical protein [Flavobacteriia bacterium]OIP48827.1 MAG: hypothetical protein AUK46_00055 [Flavobacteriaceae bacterium CG2_30_31_66]PIV96264.1 MAG: hypothetical protein COW43_09035 [Flavobacteriaceae bacterium CG17_big_fil_post_rev_8_21_14_2_50_31_13]PIX12683.1 MAG: hypothetical protein COZ74_10230 [Flavobacteriaceae bacterium CG_4_8_14_3_um_filter_31_8]PIY15775.1 MAG: hypothetical protein COZ16_02860 [Flavobacteriaceae bacterium CG_4_10_14_3_um_filter_31_253]PIZ10684.1 MAG: hypotheti